MSTNTDVTFNTSSVGVEEPTLITATTAVDVTPQVQESIVEGHKKEYSIVGDGLYASVNAAEAPTWLTGLIDSTVSTAVAGGMADYDLLVQDVRNAVDSIDVAKNTYVTQISVTPLVDGIVTTRLDTLNATNGITYATKVELTTAVATSDAAMLQNISNLEASLNGSIDAKITNVQTALATETGALASDITALETAYVDQESGLSAAATAVSGLKTYVGLGPTGVPDGTGLIDSVQSLSTFYVDLQNEVLGVDGHVNTSLNALELSSAAYTDAVENKFAYNSTIRLASGNYYTAGFGLKAVGTTGTGTELDPYNSEFWINAEKFKFTNTNQTGQAAPFTIDASGTTPAVTFNGKVSFNNVNGAIDAAVASYGVVPAYSNTPADAISFNATEKALELSSTTALAIGLAFPAFGVNAVSDELLSISLSLKAGGSSTVNLYIFEYDSNLPVGKAHVSGFSTTLTVGATRTTSWVIDYPLGVSWATFSKYHKPAPTAKWVSVVVYRPTSGGYTPLYIRDYQRSGGGQDLDAALGSTGTTVIDGGRITTGTIDAGTVNVSNISANNITTGTINSARINTDTLVAKHIQVSNPTTQFTLNDTASGTFSSPNISGAYIKGGTIYGSTLTTGSNFSVDAAGVLTCDQAAIKRRAVIETQTIAYTGAQDVPGGYYGIDDIWQYYPAGTTLLVKTAYVTFNTKDYDMYSVDYQQPYTAEAFPTGSNFFWGYNGSPGIRFFAVCSPVGSRTYSVGGVLSEYEFSVIVKVEIYAKLDIYGGNTNFQQASIPAFTICLMRI